MPGRARAPGRGGGGTAGSRPGNELAGRGWRRVSRSPSWDPGSVPPSLPPPGASRGMGSTAGGRPPPRGRGPWNRADLDKAAPSLPFGRAPVLLAPPSSHSFSESPTRGPLGEVRLRGREPGLGGWSLMLRIRFLTHGGGQAQSCKVSREERQSHRTLQRRTSG